MAKSAKLFGEKDVLAALTAFGKGTTTICVGHKGRTAKVPGSRPLTPEALLANVQAWEGDKNGVCPLTEKLTQEGQPSLIGGCVGATSHTDKLAPNEFRAIVKAALGMGADALDALLAPLAPASNGQPVPASNGHKRNGQPVPASV